MKRSEPRPPVERRRMPPAISPVKSGTPSLQAVVDAIRLGKARTRREVAAYTGLSSSIVARRVDELIALGLLEDNEHTLSTGGRAPRRLSMRGDSGRVLAIDLGANGMDAALANMAGEVLIHRAVPIDVDGAPEGVLEAITSVLDDLLEDDRKNAAQLTGIGMGLPAPVAFNEGYAVAPPLMPAWDRYPVRSFLEERYGVPAWIDNDVNIMALGEVRAGGLRDAKFGIAIKVDAGIGAGITTNGMIHRGAEGCAGDVGHIRVSETSTIRCRCGNLGCLEALAGGAAIQRDGTEAGRRGDSAMLADLLAEKGVITTDDVLVCAQRGDSTSQQLLQHASELVGSMLATVVNTLNPDVVVVGGIVAKAGDFFLAGIQKQVYGRSLPLATRSLKIERSTLGERSGVVGATWLAIDGIYSRARPPAGMDRDRHQLRRTTA